MSPKILGFCVQAFLIQSITGQRISPAPTLAPTCAAAPLIASTWGAGPAALAASNGPGLAVSSASPLIPVGVSVLTENAYEGTLAAGGAVPFLGTVALEGALLTVGTGAIAYGCGNGAVAIIAEDIRAGLAGPLGVVGPLGVAESLAITRPLGIAGPLAVTGCGYGLS